MFNFLKKKPVKILPFVYEVYDKGYGIENDWFSNYLGDVLFYPPEYLQGLAHTRTAQKMIIDIAKQIWLDADHVELNLMKSNGFRKRDLRLDDFFKVFPDFEYVYE